MVDTDAIEQRLSGEFWYRNAPDDIRALLDLVSRLREQVEQLKDERNALLREGRIEWCVFDGPIGETIIAQDWAANGACGAGLHFGPTPRHARDYFEGATRFLECSIPVKDASGIPGGTAKIKAKSCRVIREVTIDGDPL